MKRVFYFFSVLIFLNLGSAFNGFAQEKDTHIFLLVRGDDMGVSQSINEACIQSFKKGIVRSVEVIVPGSWFLDAVRLLQANPGLDVGVHLCLTSEWERCKWKPLTWAPSLVDSNGYFRPMTSQRKDFPPDTGFREAKPNLAEVEKELRAQIELARCHLPAISHVSAHMGTAVCTPELREMVTRVVKEYSLRLEDRELKGIRGFTGKNAAEKEAALVKILETLQPGKWLLVEHPGLDTPELRAFGHVGYENVAEDRAAVTEVFCSARIKGLIENRGIRLISYKDLSSQ